MLPTPLFSPIDPIIDLSSAADVTGIGSHGLSLASQIQSAGEQVNCYTNNLSQLKGGAGLADSTMLGHDVRDIPVSAHPRCRWRQFRYYLALISFFLFIFIAGDLPTQRGEKKEKEITFYPLLPFPTSASASASCCLGALLTSSFFVSL